MSMPMDICWTRGQLEGSTPTASPPAGIHVYTEAHDSVPDAEMLASAAPGAPSVQLFHAE